MQAFKIELTYFLTPYINVDEDLDNHFSLYNALPRNFVRTLRNTKASVYENYYSYHKPISTV